MENLTTITLIFLIFGAAASNKECLNLKGENETCTILQFCSHSELNRGCRNCTDIYRAWCDEDRDTFRKKYPECEILCQSKQREEAEAELDKLSGEILRLKLTLWIIGALFSVGIIAAVVAFAVFRCLLTKPSSSLENGGTATPEKTSFMGRFRSCFSTACGRRQRRPVSAQQEDPVQNATPLITSAPMPDVATSAV